MARPQQIFTDEIIVEFRGDLSPVIRDLGFLLRGYHKTYPPNHNSWWESSDAFQEYMELCERMSKRAPEGYYFGAHPTHPQCLGYWPTS